MAALNSSVKPFVTLIILVILSGISNSSPSGPGIDHGYVLYSSEALYKSDTLRYGNYTLEFNIDCKLVLSDTGKQIWASSNPPIDRRCKCVLEKYGNLVIWSRNPLDQAWYAFKPPYPTDMKFSFYVLVLQKDRNLVIYGPPIWNPDSGPTYFTEPIPASSEERYVLYDVETINPGESLKNGKYSLVMQKDCNLVLYEDETPLWSTETAEINNHCICTLQSDGNLVVYTPQNRPIWAAFKGRSQDDDGHYVLVLQSNGYLILYGKPIWSSGTQIAKAMPAINFHNTAAETNGAINGFSSVI